jgi:FMN reductase
MALFMLQIVRKLFSIRLGSVNMKITGISGSLGSPSRTKGLVTAIVRQLEARFRVRAHIADLSETAPLLWASGFGKDGPVEIRNLLNRIESSDVLVVGSPVYKGAYSGLFKHTFDLVDRNALRGKIVLLAATGGSDQHALVIEHHLRPLFAFFGAYTVPIGIYANESDFADYDTIANPAILIRIEQAVDQVAYLAGRSAVPAAAVA